LIVFTQTVQKNQAFRQLIQNINSKSANEGCFALFSLFYTIQVLCLLLAYFVDDLPEKKNLFMNLISW